MKLAVLSDIHGNVPALQAVLEDIRRWAPDEVIVNGDLVSRGPYSLAALRLLQSQLPGCHFLKGNHEAFVLYCERDPNDPNDPLIEMRQFAHWSYRQLDTAVEEIRYWQDHLDLTDLDGGASVHVTHGSRLGNRSGISARTSDEELPAKLGEARDLFVGSHTHKPLHRRFNGTLVVNTGSVGQPMDGDSRAAYGRFVLAGGRWQAEIVRVEYDKIQAEKDFFDSGFLAEAGPIPQLIYRELQDSQAHVGPWRRLYEARIKAGQISVVDAVRDYLAAV